MARSDQPQGIPRFFSAALHGYSPAHPCARESLCIFYLRKDGVPKKYPRFAKSRSSGPGLRRSGSRTSFAGPGVALELLDKALHELRSSAPNVARIDRIDRNLRVGRGNTRLYE